MASEEIDFDAIDEARRQTPTTDICGFVYHVSPDHAPAELHFALDTAWASTTDPECGPIFHPLSDQNGISLSVIDAFGDDYIRLRHVHRIYWRKLKRWFVLKILLRLPTRTNREHRASTSRIIEDILRSQDT